MHPSNVSFTTVLHYYDEDIDHIYILINILINININIYIK